MDWVDSAIPSPAPASDTAVRAAERALRVPLPEAFLAVAAVHQGAAPVPARLQLPDGSGTAVQHLLHFEDQPFVSNIVAARFPLADVLPKGVIPFAHDVGLDVFCFNYREDFDRPSVGYWSVDSGLVPVAEGFAEFLDLLTD